LRANGSPLADIVAATVSRLEAGAPSRYDVRLDDQREKVAHPSCFGGTDTGREFR